MSNVFLLFGSDMVFARYEPLYRSLEARGLEVVEVVLGGHGEVHGLGSRRFAHPELERDPLKAAQDIVAWLGSGPVSDRAIGGAVLGEQSVIAGSLTLELLGLPGPGVRAAVSSRDKSLQRSLCRDGVTWVRVSTDSPERDIAGYEGRWPAIMKPTAGHSSSGVVRVHSAREAADVARSHDPSGETLLLESEIVGDEVSVESVVADRRIVRSETTLKLTTENSDRFVEMGHHVGPTALSEELEAAVQDANARVVGELGVRTAATHAEFRLGDAGPVLMETAVRPGGDAVWLLHHLATGVPLESTLCAAALGEITEPVCAEAQRWAAQHYARATPGHEVAVTWNGPPTTVVSVANAAPWPRLSSLPADAEPQVRCVLRHKPDGDPVPALSKSGDRVCSVVVDAPTGRELDAVRSRAEEYLVSSQPVSHGEEDRCASTNRGRNRS